MNDIFSQINIYEKGESQNAFPLKIWFELDFSDSRVKYTNETICDFMNNNASGLTLALLNKNKK